MFIVQKRITDRVLHVTNKDVCLNLMSKRLAHHFDEKFQAKRIIAL